MVGAWIALEKIKTLEQLILVPSPPWTSACMIARRQLEQQAVNTAATIARCIPKMLLPAVVSHHTFATCYRKKVCILYIWVLHHGKAGPYYCRCKTMAYICLNNKQAILLAMMTDIQHQNYETKLHCNTQEIS